MVTKTFDARDPRLVKEPRAAGIVPEALDTRNPTYQGSLCVAFVKITKVGVRVIGLS